MERMTDEWRENCARMARLRYWLERNVMWCNPLFMSLKQEVLHRKQVLQSEHGSETSPHFRKLGHKLLKTYQPTEGPELQRCFLPVINIEPVYLKFRLHGWFGLVLLLTSIHS